MPILSHLKPDYMNIDELNIFADSVGHFLDENAPPNEIKRWSEEGSVGRALWEKAGAAGLLGVSVPEAYGGVGGDFRHEVVIMEQLAFKGAQSFVIPLHNATVAPYLIDYASEEQKKRWLPSVVSGETLLAVAMSEPGAGSDLQAMKTSARRDGDHYIINGQKTFISNGLHASLVVVAAKTDTGAGAKGITLFAVEVDKVEGFSRGRLLHKIGQAGRDTTELYFSDMRVPAANILGGQEGQGFRMLMEKLPQERMVIAWQSMAMAEAAIKHTIDYVKERKAFGKSVMDFQNTQFKLAECKTQATIGKVFLYHCTEKLMQKKLDAATASMAKYWVSEMQGRVIDECLQLYGGYGYMTEFPIAEMYKDARAARIYGGTNEIMKLLIARSL